MVCTNESFSQENPLGYWIKNLTTTAHAFLRDYSNLIEPSDAGPQQLVHQSTSSLSSSTHETEDVSNNSHDTHPGGIRYLSNWVDPVADPSLSSSYASRSATELPQYDWWSSIPTYPAHTAFSVPDVDAQRPDSMNYHNHHDITNPIPPLSTQYEIPQYQSNIPARMASNYHAPYDIPNQEANTSDPRSPHGAWNTYHAFSDGQVLTTRNYPL
jgi:hypothetical protein